MLSIYLGLVLRKLVFVVFFFVFIFMTVENSKHEDNYLKACKSGTGIAYKEGKTKKIQYMMTYSKSNSLKIIKKR